MLYITGYLILRVWRCDAILNHGTYEEIKNIENGNAL